ncbi:MAG: rhomboid family intramembrane serine protease [Rhodobacterales bacterium]|nr:MAG: rhomboid family intramembrane serine protease [Rhodobacterales bacterium]
MSSNPNTSPVNPVPPVVVAIFLIMLVVEAAFTLGNQGFIGGPQAVGWRLAALSEYGFINDRFDYMVKTNTWFARELMRLITYPFLHGSMTHMIMGGVMLLAMGKFVGDVFAGWAVAVVFFASAIGGAVIWALLLDSKYPLIGAFPGVYGLIGAFTFLLWLRLGQLGENQMRAFTMIGFLMGIQLVFGILFGSDTQWVADVAGFLVGFLMSFVVSPGGWRRLRARLRTRG